MTLGVGVNLLWLVPGVVGGSEDATVSTLTAMVQGEPDVALRLYALDSLRDAHPGLVDSCPTRSLPITGRVKPVRVVAELAWLAATSRRDRLDVVHHAGGVVPVTSPSPTVLTIHDLQPLDHPEHFSPAKVAYLRMVLPRSARRATVVVTPSRASADRVVERLAVRPDRVRVVPHGVEPAQFEPLDGEVIEGVRRDLDLPERWITYPVITYPHKNHVTLVDAFARLAPTHPDVALVLPGGEGPAEAEVGAAVARSGVADRIRRTGRLSRRALDAVVAGAALVAFPSRYEGFGLGVVEAMARGVPVVVSSSGSLPELVGDDAGIVVDPDDADGWVDALAAILDDPSLATRYGVSGRRRAETFTAAASASALVEAYRAAAVT